MSLQDLLALLPKHERDRLMQAAAFQRQILDFYLSAHRDIAAHLNSQLLALETRSLTPQQMMLILREQRTLTYLDSRVAALNRDVAAALRQVGPRVSATVTAQVARELRAVGLEGVTIMPPDPKVLERHLEFAIRRITSWNKFIRREALANIRAGLLKGESYREIAARVSARTVSGPNTAPVTRARSRMLANVRYAVVRSANAAREESYQQSQRQHGLEVRKIWFATIDSCCISCALLHGQIVDVGTMFQWEHLNLSITPLGNELPHPPLHPNCRCRIVPVTDEILTALDQRSITANRDRRLVQLRSG